MTTSITPTDRTITSHARVIGSRYAASNEGAYLAVITRYEFATLTYNTIVGKVTPNGMTHAVWEDVIDDPSFLRCHSAPSGYYAEQDLIEEHEQFLREQLTEERMPKLLEWAGSAVK